MKKPNLSCVDCGKHGEAYFVKDKVWYDNVPVSKQRKNLCLSCLEKRMGRKLKKSDFKQDDGTFTTNQQWWGRVGESMNIKQIIREELGSDWDFMDDVPYFENTPISILFNTKPTEEEYLKVAKILEDEGFRWYNRGELPTEWSPVRYWSKGGGLIYMDNKKLLQSPKNSQRFNGRVEMSNEIINAEDLINEY